MVRFVSNEEAIMAKDTTGSASTAPLFTLARTLLEEMDQQAGRWLEYGFQQQKETAEVVRAFREQAMGITRTVLTTVEQTTGSMLDAAKSYSPFTARGAA
jgi:hypothetical protein